MGMLAIDAWIADLQRGQGETPEADLYDAYRGWCARGRYQPVKQAAFGRALTEAGFDRVRRNRICRLGVSLSAAQAGRLSQWRSQFPPAPRPAPAIPPPRTASRGYGLCARLAGWLHALATRLETQHAHL